MSEEKTFKREYAPHRRASIRICKQCGKNYTISDSDTIYFVTKFGTIPLMCPDCRQKKHTVTKVDEEVNTSSEQG